MNISGFIVLRKPSFNYDEKGRGVFLPYAPRIGDLYYAGIDRMPWFEVDEAYHSNALPDELVRLRQELHNAKLPSSDFMFISEIDKAIKLLNYSNRNKSFNELIAVHSNQFARVGNIDLSSLDIDCLGIDIYRHGYGSLVREGIFTRPELFSYYVDKLNVNGLFDLKSDLIDGYIETYVKVADSNKLEPIEEEAIRCLDKVELGRVRV